MRILLGCAGPFLLTAPGPIDIAISAPPARCSLSTLPLGVLSPASRLYFTAVATDDSAAVTKWMYPMRGPGRISAPAIKPRTLHGQVFRVDTVGGPDADDLLSRMNRLGSREVVVVPWDYSGACVIIPIGKFTRIAPAGQVVYFTLTLRPDSLWAGTRPTFDAAPFQFSGYPFGSVFPYDYARRSGVGYLTAREIFSLRNAAPDPWGTTLDSTTRARLDAWFAANPGLVASYPADAVMSLLRPRDYSLFRLFDYSIIRPDTGFPPSRE